MIWEIHKIGDSEYYIFNITENLHVEISYNKQLNWFEISMICKSSKNIVNVSIGRSKNINKAIRIAEDFLESMKTTLEDVSTPTSFETYEHGRNSQGYGCWRKND